MPYGVRPHSVFKKVVCKMSLEINHLGTVVPMGKLVDKTIVWASSRFDDEYTAMMLKSG